MPGAFNNPGNSDLLANRPAPGAAGSKPFFLAVDTGQWYWTDGNAWHPIGAAALPLVIGSGNYHFPQGQSGTATTVMAQGVGRAVPFQVPRDLTLVRIGVEITTAGDAGSVGRLGIYSDNGSGYPGALNLDCGTIPGDVPAVSEIVINQPLTAGLHWLVGVSQLCPVTGPTWRFAAPATNIVPISWPTTPGTNAVWVALSIIGMLGALPDPFPAGLNPISTALRLFVKVA